VTLTLTVTTPRCIYQSADYRLTDVQTGATRDFDTQKIFLVNTFKWTASICFAGVGRTKELDVGEWLGERVAAIDIDDAFDHFVEEILTADVWLSRIPPPHNRHSFSIGAFVGADPVFLLISNFEQLSGLSSNNAARRLSVFRNRPTKPKTFVSGQPWAVSRQSRRRLEALAARDPAPERMYLALTELNRSVATRTDRVSPACFATHLRLTGEGGGSLQDDSHRPFAPPFAFPLAGRDVIMRHLEQQYGPGRARLKAIATSRLDSSDEYHHLQLREKPDDPNVHSNYGAYLKDKKADLQGAEREYRRALELNENHANALGNLANLLWEKGDTKEAAALYKKALEAEPGHENVTWNYARFVLNEFHDGTTARKLVENGIAAHPDSRRLLLLKAELCLRDAAIPDALESYQLAREQGANPAQIEPGYASALQLSGAPIGECIGLTASR
jgi:tetratricopeptide (TPR) repeat protein